MANQNENHKEGKESDKEKDADNNRTEDGKLVLITIVIMTSFAVGACDPDIRLFGTAREH